MQTVTIVFNSGEVIETQLTDSVTNQIIAELSTGNGSHAIQKTLESGAIEATYFATRNISSFVVHLNA